MKKVIITGVNGQLGQYLAKYLTEEVSDIQVVGTRRHKSYDLQPCIFDQDKVQIELMEASDSHSIENIILKHKPDYFVNTAANAFVGDSWVLPVQHLEVNTLAVVHQLEAIRKHSPHTRYFNMGSSEEFGKVKYSPQDESHLLSPRSPYGVSKIAARHIVEVWRDSYNLFAVQGITFNFESKLRGHKYVTRKCSLGVARIANAIKNELPFEPIELGNVNSYRDWQHASDVARGIWLMLNYDKPETFILSSGETHSVKEFVELAFKEANIEGFWHGNGLNEEFCVSNHLMEEYDLKSSVLVKINPKFFRPAEVDLLHGNSSKAREKLGWTPKYSFPDLVKEMVRHDLQSVI